jgi:acyl-CoA thioester hydrolase
MFSKDFEVRWSDLDANRHLANSAYVNFMSHTRMAYFMEVGIDHETLVARQLAPVVLYEHMYYFKEILPGEPVSVTLEVTGLSLDGMFFEYHHNMYDRNGKNVAHAEIMGAWISLKNRSLTPLPDDWLERFNWEVKSDSFRILTKEDTRKYGKIPRHREPGS